MRKISGAIIVLASCLSNAAMAQSAKDDYKFTYTYPSQVRAIPVLKAQFDRDAAKQRAEMATNAAADRRAAAKDGRPFNGYEGDNNWKVGTDTPRFLSLSFEGWEFTGGAHGNSAYASLVWDRTTNQRRTTLSFFTGKAALAAAVRPAFCRQLTAARREKRGGEAGSGTSITEFDKCIDPAETTVILGSTNHQRFDRVGFLMAPYEAGPYAEGAYEVTVPVTPAVIAAVRPECRRYFALGR